MASGAMLGVFILLQSVVLSQRGRFRKKPEKENGALR